MKLSALSAISPIDGRYRHQVQQLDEFFSELAFMKYRVFVEVEYLLFLEKNNFFKLPAKIRKDLSTLFTKFSLKEATAIKKLEAKTNHDVKAVEYFIKKRLDKNEGQKYVEWVHFGLTSQDINNTAL
nr:lyase family protein [Chitinophagaceae bacterium]